MNRPNYIDYVCENRKIQEYTKELEKYCDELEKKYKLTIKIASGLGRKCPMSITKDCDDFKNCGECWDYFIQSEVERIKDE